MNRLSKNRGFTLVELITIIVMIGILAAVALPRFFDRTVFENRGFYDQVIASIRYAQKEAISQRRFVCVAFTSTSVTLTYDATAPSAAHMVATCPGANLVGPAGPLSPLPCSQTTYSVCSTRASFVAVFPAALSFDALGRPSDATGVLLAAQQSITVSGYATAIRIERETGYVH